MFCVFALQLEEIKKLYTETYRASEKAAEKIQSKNSQNDGGNNSADGYNVNTQLSVKKQWHTGLNKSQIKKVLDSISKAGVSGARQITDNTYWYKGRLEGDGYFAIYSVSDSSPHPTIFYFQKGDDAETELDILIDLLEEEYGESIDKQSSFTQRVSSRSWLQNVNNSTNNQTNLGAGANNRNAGVLQNAPKGNGSGAFWNVIGNIFEKQEQSRRGVTQDSNTQNSIKETTGRRFLEAINSNEDDVARKLLNEQAKQNG